MASLPPSNDDRSVLDAAIDQAALGNVNERIVVPIVQERAVVEKLVQETGIVRVHMRTLEQDETVRFETVEETVSIERVPIDRIVDGPVEVRQEGDTMVIPVLEEVVVVEKRLMLREEVRLTRTRTTIPHERTVTLRKEEATIERDDPNP